MAIRDFTQVIKNINYSDKKEAKNSEINSISIGLYVMVFINPSEISIRDKNKSYKSTLQGRVVVPPQSVVLKSGKFQNGLFARMRDYVKHMHQESVPDVSVFKSSLIKAIVFPMDNFSKQIEKKLVPSSIYEGYWNQSISQHLHVNGFLSDNQKFRTEYRLLNSSEYCLGNSFYSFMEKVSENIEKSTEHLF